MPWTDACRSVTSVIINTSKVLLVLTVSNNKSHHGRCHKPLLFYLSCRCLRIFPSLIRLRLQLPRRKKSHNEDILAQSFPLKLGTIRPNFKPFLIFSFFFFFFLLGAHASRLCKTAYRYNCQLSLSRHVFRALTQLPFCERDILYRPIESNPSAGSRSHQCPLGKRAHR